ncbi:MAG: IclR family transcriptional regulator [Lautropia sp.]
MDKTLLKGLHVLELLVQDPGEHALAALAKQLDVPKSNIHRTLQTLVAAGYAVSATKGSYKPTMKLWSLGNVVAGRQSVRKIAQPVLGELSALTGESILLAVMDGLDVIIIDKVEPRQPVGTLTKMGERLPGYCTGIGKGLFAFVDAEILALFPTTLHGYTSRTITTRRALLQEFATTRARGYSINTGEYNLDVGGVAAPIYDSTGEVCASVSISAPSSRLTREVIETYAGYVQRASRTLSEQLGWRAQPAHAAVRARG